VLSRSTVLYGYQSGLVLWCCLEIPWKTDNIYLSCIASWEAYLRENRGSRRGLSEPLWLSLLRSRIAGQRCSSSTSTWSVHASNNKNLLNRRTSYGILLYICAPTWVTLHNASLRRVTALFSSWSRDVVLPWMTPPRFSARPIVI